MKKLNCWEVHKCGRDGSSASVKICPVPFEAKLHGVHGGAKAGRACWVVAGTMCGGKEQGTFAHKYHNCEKCQFYQQVKKEEGMKYELSIMLLQKLRGTEALAGKKIPAKDFDETSA
jgi:hypothetical protein